MSENEGIERFVEALGQAALELWSELPPEIQHTLFERAVVCGHKSERDESLREQLAAFLHRRHDRTAKGPLPYPPPHSESQDARKRADAGEG